MRISKLDVVMIALQLKEPFRFAYGTFYELPRVLIRVEAEASARGVVGWGEAAIDFPFVTYDMFDVYHALSELRAQLVGTSVENNREALLTETLNSLRATPAALCAVNMALDDLAGRVQGVSAGHLYGIMRAAGMPLCSIGFDQAADLEVWAGAPGIIKIKVGQGLSLDIETIRLAEEIAEETGKQYALDFNAAYALREVIELINNLKAGGFWGLKSCLLWEQPVTGNSSVEDWQRLVMMLAEQANRPVLVADESFVSAPLGLQLTEAGVGLNYKIQKFGGILAAVELENSIEGTARGAKSFVGGTFPSPLGRAYDILAGRVIRSATLPGDGLLPASTYLSRDCANAFPGDTDPAGLGVRPDESALARLIVEDPVEEYYRIRTGRTPERIKVDVGDSYAEKYIRLSGKSVLWNIRG